MFALQVKLLLTFGLFLLQWQAVDSRPNPGAQGRIRHRREFNVAHLGALVASQTGILNQECKYSFNAYLRTNIIVLLFFTGVPLYDCEDILEAGSNKSGLYRIDPGGLGDFTVFCDMELLGGGWTVIQRRVDGSKSFDKPWKFYRNGFGDFGGNVWLGLNKIKRITDMNSYELYIGLEDQEFTDTNTAWTRYGSFSLSSEETNYKLHISDWDNSSTAGDALDFHSEQSFSTSDRDNDEHHSVHCSQQYEGGWWFKDCHRSNLNGVWYARADTTRSDNEGIIWEDWKSNSSLKTTVMAIRKSKSSDTAPSVTSTPVNANM